MIADVHETANGKSQRAAHWHLMGVGGRVPPLLVAGCATGYRAMARTGFGNRFPGRLETTNPRNTPWRY